MTEQAVLYAEVVLPLPLDKSFHYAIPRELAGRLRPGMRVEVPFGKKNLTGYVTRLADEPGVAEVKNIVSLLDPEPVISEELFALARWLKENYFCSLGEALATIASPSLKAPKRKIEKLPETLPAPGKGPVLSCAQKKAVEAITKAVLDGKHAAFLVHGVTSSGKTEVYLAAIEEALKNGRSVVFLLPEISLTPQFIAIVRRRFPGIVGLWHSKLSQGERYRTWDAARQGKIKIMMGARSALFAPFDRLGLIVMDEEHEPTYKQEQKPAYQTRDAVLERTRLNNAVAVFGSATPSLELYFRARREELTLLELAERIDGRGMPPVKIVDPYADRRGSRILTAPIVSTLTRVLARREQAILFLNRRGFSPAVMCHACGEVWQCPHCSVSLVYHKDPVRLRCHYCDYQEPLPGICPKCKSRDIAIFGVGTQKVEEELKRLFPQARIFRLDRDTASRKGVYEQAYEDFKQENVDILIGTQMVAKGFDFPRVTFVGVIDADTALYLPDFRAAERTFQLLTQVAGRSG
ncbi:MAG: replication restart helicase PriA, partial [Endomicrobiales bacterium]